MDGPMWKKPMGITGTPLAEVFAVVICPRPEKHKLYGKIWVDDALGTLYIYNLESDEPDTISSNGRLSLSYQDRAIIPGFSDMTLHFDVKDKMNGDDEFICNSFVWSEETDGYDELLVKDVEGKRGSVKVYYTVHSCAVEVNIGAEFVIWGENMKSHPNVYGMLAARYKDNVYEDDDSEGHCETVLFCGTVSGVRNSAFLPLAKSVVAVPTYTSLVIQAYFISEEDHKVLWDGEVEFSRHDMTSYLVHGNIEGAIDQITVDFCTIDYAQYSLTDAKSYKRFCLGIGA